MIFAFLEFGSLWFWAASIIPFLFVIAFVENERGGFALGTILVTLGAFVAFGDKGMVPWVVQHPVNLVGYAVAYLVAGIAWGFIKWTFHVWTARDNAIALNKEFLSKEDKIRIELRTTIAKNDFWNKNNSNSRLNRDRTQLEVDCAAAVALALTAPKPEGFDTELFQMWASNRLSSARKPLASDNKGRIIFWMSYWPASAVWTLAHDPITRAYRFIYNRLAKGFEGISNAMYKDVQGV